ncbi:MAG: NADH-quinone oxidoreductase subunit N [Cyanobacteria bacterium SIG31]|nr:NADH-quinone oxidoreductase subunit N [Cyanobacteria bacterium SIG31]
MINDFFNILLPQGCIALFIFIQLILAMCAPLKCYRSARWISAVGISMAIMLLSTVQTEPQYFAFRGALMSDSYTLLFHFVILLCGFFVVLLAKNIVQNMRQNAFTFHALLLTAVLGAMSVVNSNDFLTLFISLELLSFPTYFLIASAKGYQSKEASFKYLITNAISTGVFLFGVSYLYGLTSSLNFNEIYEIVVQSQSSLLYTFSVIMIVLGLLSKLAIYPFANWVVDVFKGCETSVLAFLATIPKLALFGILCRLIVFALSGSFELTFVLAFLALFTALWANTYAIKEKNVKVIFGCSSAANASYILLAASLVSVYNLSTVIFYLIAYVIMNISAFAFLNIAEANKVGMYIDDFNGFFKKNIGLTLAYVVAIIGLAGFPITSGFIAKIYLFSAIAHSGLIFIPFLLALLILTVVALYYYLKLILPLFENVDNGVILKVVYSQKFVLIFTTIITVLIGIYPEKLIELCRFIAYNI